MTEVSSRPLDPQEIVVRVVEQGGWSVIAVRGEVDMVTAPTLRAHVGAAAGHDGARVVLDLAGVSFFDSSGLSAVVSGYKLLRAQHGELRVVTDSRRVVKVFEIAGLDRLIGIYPSVADAVAA